MTVVKYTDEMVNSIVADYAGGKGMDISALAQKYNRAVASIRAKLVFEGVYVKPEKIVKARTDNGPTKKELLNTLEPLVSFDVDGLTGATKEAIASIIEMATAVAKNAEADSSDSKPETA